MAFLQAEFRPCPSLGDTRVDCFAHDGCADAPCGFHLFARVVKGVADGGFGAVFVGTYCRGGKGGGVVEFFIVGPIRATIERFQWSTELFWQGNTYFANLDIFFVVCRVAVVLVKSMEERINMMISI